MGRPVEFQKFSGQIPQMDPVLLPITAAVKALDCIMWHGDIRPVNQPSQAATSGLVGTIQSIYRMGLETGNDTQYWLAWLVDADVVRGAIADDVTERTYFTTATGKPQVTNLTMATNGGGNTMPNASYDLGVLTPTAACVATINSAGSSQIQETRVYIYTWVSTFGEEGAPSPASNAVTLGEDGSVNLTGLTQPPGGNYSYQYTRIYRSVLGASGNATYEYVDQIPIAQTTYADTILDENLGEAIQTTTYFPPPTNMQGLCGGANGMMAGFVGKDVWFCVPYLPYAWPLGYQQSVSWDVVGLGFFDQTFVALTKGPPILLTGLDPTSISQQKADFNQECISKRSIASTDSGVVWASPNGLCYIGNDGTQILTQGLLQRADWQALNPSSMIGRWFDGHYFFTTTTGTYIFTPATMEFTQLSDTATALFVDPTSDQLYMAVGNEIMRFNPQGGTPRTWTWETKDVSLLSAICPAAARVDANGYPVTVTVRVNQQALPTIYAQDGVTVIHPITVNDQHAFRLPSGYRPEQYGLSLSSNQNVRYFAWANAPKDFAIG
jgi:hypothetical protein